MSISTYRKLTLFLLAAILAVQLYIAIQVSRPPAPIIRPRPAPTNSMPGLQLEPPYDTTSVSVVTV